MYKIWYTRIFVTKYGRKVPVASRCSFYRDFYHPQRVHESHSDCVRCAPREENKSLARTHVNVKGTQIIFGLATAYAALCLRFIFIFILLFFFFFKQMQASTRIGSTCLRSGQGGCLALLVPVSATFHDLPNYQIYSFWFFVIIRRAMIMYLFFFFLILIWMMYSSSDSSA